MPPVSLAIPLVSSYGRGICNVRAKNAEKLAKFMPKMQKNLQCSCQKCRKICNVRAKNAEKFAMFVPKMQKNLQCSCQKCRKTCNIHAKNAENFVLQQFISMNIFPVYYWTSGNLAELDFVILSGNKILPVEVKSGLNTRAKSLKIYREKYSPYKAIRFSMLNLKEDASLLNIPLYLIHRLPDLI